MVNKVLLRKCLDYYDKYPFDHVHDKFHHRQVIKTVLRIIKNERLENKLDIEPLILAAALHDAIDEKRGAVELQLLNLKKYLKETDIKPALSDKIIKILSEHSFGHNQKTIEEKLLYDADKIEYSNIKRIDNSVSAVKEGRMTDKKLRFYFKLWADRVLQIPGTLHHAYSRKIFIRNSRKLYIHVRKNHPIYFPLIADVGEILIGNN